MFQFTIFLSFKTFSRNPITSNNVYYTRDNTFRTRENSLHNNFSKSSNVSQKLWGGWKSRQQNITMEAFSEMKLVGTEKRFSNIKNRFTYNFVCAVRNLPKKKKRLSDLRLLLNKNRVKKLDDATKTTK